MKSLRVALATLIMGGTLGLTACDDDKTVEAPPAQTPDTGDKTAEEAQGEAQDLLDNTVGKMP